MQAHHAKFQRCTSPRASGDGAAAGRDSCGFAHRCADRQDRLNALEDGCALAMAAPRGERPRRRRLPNPALWVALCAVAGALACAALLVRGVPATALLGVRPVAPRAWLSEQTQYTGAAGRASAVPGRKASAARIAYAGIVPYVKRQGAARAHPVACDAGSSVGCVLSAAERGVLRAMASGDRRGPGRLAVEQAAKGKGFAPWDVSHQTKATRLKARRAVEASSGHGLGWLNSLWHQAANLDHEIDYGGQPLPAPAQRASAKHASARGREREAGGHGREARETASAISTTIEKLKAEKAALQQALALRRQKKQLEALSAGSSHWMNGWLDGPDVRVPAKPWAY